MLFQFLPKILFRLKKGSGLTLREKVLKTKSLRFDCCAVRLRSRVFDDKKGGGGGGRSGSSGLLRSSLNLLNLD